MAVGHYQTSFSAVNGIRMASTNVGIGSDDSPDLVLFELCPGSTSVGVFTQSHFSAAPVQVARAHLIEGPARYLLVNSGNANAATGAQGLLDARACCQAVSVQGKVKPQQVLPFSTGVIGEALPIEPIMNALPDMFAALHEDQWLNAARGIMTTDTRPKIASRQLKLCGQLVTLTGIAKGAGMIQPNMATMLSFIATDAQISESLLQEMLSSSVASSFNRITVDSDTSTNDACMLIASGQAGDLLDDCEQELVDFQDALTDLMLELAQGLVRDGEGATKFVTVLVEQGESEQQCLAIAFSIANSPLIKTALFASDANWGRIVMAIGKTDVQLDVESLDIYINDLCLMRSGTKAAEYEEADGANAMALEDIVIRVVLNCGACSETVWTSDLSLDYVKINAEYRT